MKSTIHITSAMVAGAVCLVFGAADLWYFRALAHDTALSIFYMGLGALGLTGAYSAGLNSDPTLPPTVPVLYEKPANPPAP